MSCRPYNIVEFAAAISLVLLAAPLRCDEAARSEPPITAADREHWSFQRLVRPPLPASENSDWPNTAIDRFVLSKLSDMELAPAPSADRVTIIRRVSLTLTGIPPAPDDVDSFLNDIRPDAYMRLLDRLLASPAYGQRWAQHWLDLARFAESDGFEHDHIRPEAWRYRDWVIDALNADLPYDEFLRMQLAGDELQPTEIGASAATGFALCGPDMPDINLIEERRHMVLNDVASTVGAVFLGLQVGCAQCHDHKFDPISQADFYRLRAVFEPAIDFEKHQFGRVLHEDGQDLEPSFLRVRGDFRRLGPEVEPGYLRIANQSDDSFSALPSQTSSGRRAALAAWLTQPSHPLTARVISNRLWQYHFGVGLVGTPSDFGLMGDSPSHPELLDWLAAELPLQDWSLKRMHRTVLTSSAYRQASRPLQTIADRNADVMANWERTVKLDPDNRWLSRMNRQRLDGEAIRDSMLWASGTLSWKEGGRGVMPPLPEELVDTLLKNQWQVSPDKEDHYRRSIYLFVRRNLRYPLFDVFDRPDTNASCARRASSTTATQSLTMLNSSFSWETATRLAARIWRDKGPDANTAQQISLAYSLVLSRSPTRAEIHAGEAFLAQQADQFISQQRSRRELGLEDSDLSISDARRFSALAQFCLALFNLNEFLYVD